MLFETYIRAAGLAAAAALFWLQYFDLKDRLNREPRLLLLFSYLLGLLSAAAGLLLYRLVEQLGGPADPGFTSRSIFLYCFLIVGPIEEGVKFLIARLAIFRSKHFDEVIDGMVYSSAISIGFAGFESLVYAQFAPWPEQLARALTAPLTHSLFSSMWGFGTAIGLLRAKSGIARYAWQVLPLAAAAATHGVYDYVLLAYDATYSASGLALVLWAFLIVYARKSVAVTAKAQSY